MRFEIGVILVGLCLTSPGYAQTTAYTANQPTLTFVGAEKVLQTATARAVALHAPSNFAVVDRSGTLLAFKRMDGAFVAGVPISIGKARSAARFQRPTETLEHAINTGRPAVITAGSVAMKGGVPITMDGVVVGAIGVSGFDANNDVEIATAAAKLD
jgi:glc operon protein GlcG